MTTQQINEIFTYHAPTVDQIQTYGEIRSYAYTFALRLNELCPESREKSLAITRLQECVQMANAAIAIHNGPAKGDQNVVNR